MSTERERVFENLEKAFEIRKCSVHEFLRDVFIFLGQKTGKCDSSGEFVPLLGEATVVKAFRECHAAAGGGGEESPFWPATLAEEVVVDYSHEIASFCVDMNTAEEIEVEERPEGVPAAGTTDDDIAAADDESETLKKLTIDDDIDLERDISLAALDRLAEKPEGGEQGSKESESFNGAVRDAYSWSQSIGELDVIIKVPDGVKSSKKVKVDTTPYSICVQYLSDDAKWAPIIDDQLSQKIKCSETVWVMSEGFIRIHLEKHVEKWWNALLESEPKLDTSTLNCSRPLHELPEEEIEKIKELRFNHLQKLAGQPTSEDMKREAMLRKAWDAPGSPFAGKPFDPTVFSN